MAIELTPRAVEKVREIMRDQGLTEGGLRVGVKGGGCSGLSYNLALDTDERRERDRDRAPAGARVSEHQ